MNAVTVRSFKYDGQPHRSWSATLRHRAGTLITLDAVFAEPVAHPLIGHIPQGTISTEFYWTDRWYSVFRFAAPNGALLMTEKDWARWREPLAGLPIYGMRVEFSFLGNGAEQVREFLLEAPCFT